MLRKPFVTNPLNDVVFCKQRTTGVSESSGQRLFGPLDLSEMPRGVAFARQLKMKCQEIQFDLPLYSDDLLSYDRRAVIDGHLNSCPLCRQALSDYHEIRSGLRSLARPVPAARQINSLRQMISANLRPEYSLPYFALVETKRSFREVWLMPYAVGSFASLFFAVSLLWLLFSPFNRTEFAYLPERGLVDPDSAISIANGDHAADISPFDYANSRISVSAQSPSVNPKGALIALTKSIVRGEMRDDEVVVVADVFGNGLADIAEVVEYPHDRQKIVELRKALRSDPAYAPFVPAKMDGRATSVRVVLKLQSVNVDVGSESDSPQE